MLWQKYYCLVLIRFSVVDFVHVPVEQDENEWTKKKKKGERKWSDKKKYLHKDKVRPKKKKKILLKREEEI